jgi:hypothetical protein
MPDDEPIESDVRVSPQATASHDKPDGRVGTRNPVPKKPRRGRPPTPGGYKRVFTEEQRERRRQRTRALWASKTPEQKWAEGVKQRKSRSPEYRARRRAKGMARGDYVPHKSVTDHTGREIIKVLGGVKPPTSRQNERGFEGWKPLGTTLVLVDQVKAILKEYKAHLPLTVRQILYRMMGKFGHEKTLEPTLYELTLRARRARVIDMDAIRDDGGVHWQTTPWDSAEQYWRDVKHQSQQLCHDRQAGQSKRLVVYCEAAGMVPQLARIANPYGVPVISSGGYDSLTEKHIFGRDHHNVEVLHLGDYDPSGLWMFIALAEDVSALAREYGNTVDFSRLAVTEQQISRFALKTQPVNRNDTRSFPGTVSCQLEAIPPDDLANLVREAIVSRLDMEIYSAVLQREKKLHVELAKRFETQQKPKRKPTKPKRKLKPKQPRPKRNPFGI